MEEILQHFLSLHMVAVVVDLMILVQVVLVEMVDLVVVVGIFNLEQLV